MTLLQLIILSLIQGAAELLPVSSSAHVIVAQKMMGLDPSAPEMTLLLVMLHTGTMFAVLIYFWRRWYGWFRSPERWDYLKYIIVATILTGILGLGLKWVIEKVIHHSSPNYEIEDLFRNLRLIVVSLFATGIFILLASGRDENSQNRLSTPSAAGIGLIQGLCLPFRGFSRSGATISMGLLLGVSRRIAEEFSFILAVVLTPPVIARELYRMHKHGLLHSNDLFASQHLGHSLLGMCFSFVAGLAALRWLSVWLEKGKWKVFGLYCFAAGAAILALRMMAH